MKQHLIQTMDESMRSLVYSTVAVRKGTSLWEITLQYMS